MRDLPFQKHAESQTRIGFVKQNKVWFRLLFTKKVVTEVIASGQQGSSRYTVILTVGATRVIVIVD